MDNKKTTKNVLEQYKAEASAEVGVDLKNPELKAKDAGKVGGLMVKDMISKVTGK